MNSSSQKQPAVMLQAEFEFRDMQLKVGDKLQLKIRSNMHVTCCSNNGGSCMVTLIGYVSNKCLLVTLPKSEQFNLPLIQGDELLVRLFSGQSAFSFTVYVDSIIKQPFSYMHLSFPTKIVGQTIRKSRRIRTQIHATVSGFSAPMMMTNLSTTGAEIRTKIDLGEADTEINLSFQIEFEEKNVPIQLQSIIRSCRIIPEEDDSLTLIYGIEFIDLQPEQTFALCSFIHQELVSNPVQII